MKKICFTVMALVAIAFVSPALAVDEFYSDCKIINYENGDFGAVCKDGNKTKVFGFSSALVVLEGVDKKTRTVAVETPNGIKTFVENRPVAI